MSDIALLGPIGERLYSDFPELRVALDSLIAGEHEFRSRLGDDGSDEISIYQTFSVFRDEALVPAIVGLPATGGYLKRCFEFMRFVLETDPAEHGHYRTALYLRVVEKVPADCLIPDRLQVMAKFDKSLADEFAAVAGNQLPD